MRHVWTERWFYVVNQHTSASLRVRAANPSALGSLGTSQMIGRRSTIPPLSSMVTTQLDGTRGILRTGLQASIRLSDSKPRSHLLSSHCFRGSITPRESKCGIDMCSCQFHYDRGIFAGSYVCARVALPHCWAFVGHMSIAFEQSSLPRCHGELSQLEIQILHAGDRCM